MARINKDFEPYGYTSSTFFGWFAAGIFSAQDVVFNYFNSVNNSPQFPKTKIKVDLRTLEVLSFEDSSFKFSHSSGDDPDRCEKIKHSYCKDGDQDRFVHMFQETNLYEGAVCEYQQKHGYRSYQKLGTAKFSDCYFH